MKFLKHTIISLFAISGVAQAANVKDFYGRYALVAGDDDCGNYLDINGAVSIWVYSDNFTFLPQIDEGTVNSGFFSVNTVTQKKKMRVTISGNTLTIESKGFYGALVQLIPFYNKTTIQKNGNTIEMNSHGNGQDNDEISIPNVTCTFRKG